MPKIKISMSSGPTAHPLPGMLHGCVIHGDDVREFTFPRGILSSFVMGDPITKDVHANAYALFPGQHEAVMCMLALTKTGRYSGVGHEGPDYYVGVSTKTIAEAKALAVTASFGN